MICLKAYRVESKNINKCNDCGKDIDKFNIFYMFVIAQSEIKFYLCKECKDKLKNILKAEWRINSN